MEKTKIWGGLFALVLAFGLVGPVSANEALPSEYDCNQDPMYTRDFNGQVTISSRLRDVPCMDQSNVIRVLAQGKVVKVIAEMDGWYKIKDSDGQTGWVGATLIKATDAATTNSNEQVSTTATTNTNIVSRLKGYILLQVEQHGEAWYVNPVNSFRYFLRDGDTAYNVMRQMGLGISNANLEKLKSKEQSLVDRLKGRIVLQVEKNGEAYYVDPRTGALSYLKNGWEAYNVMRNLSLGIKDADLSKIQSQEVSSYDNTTAVVNTNRSIVLTGSGSGAKASLKWTLNNITSSMGFKVVVADHENPVYPGDEYHYLSNADVRTDSWSGLEAGTYYFRVCEYLGGKCGVYSNNLKVVITGETAVVSNGSIALSGSVNDEGIATLNWTLNNMTSSMGFKVVVADHENPVYPGDEYHYLSDAGTRADSWSDLSGAKYFRVCEYLGGKCGVYSNNLQLNF